MSTQSVESFNIDYSEQLGFNAVAAQDLKPGDVVICEQPFSYQLTDEYQFQMCDYCYRDASNEIQMKRCTRCKQVSYCSKECQTKHWYLAHKLECKIFAQLSAEQIRYHTRILYRFYFRTMNMLQNEQQQKLDNSNSDSQHFKASNDIHDRGKPTLSQLISMNSSPIPRTVIHTSNDALTLISHKDGMPSEIQYIIQRYALLLLQILKIDPSSAANFFNGASQLEEMKEIFAKCMMNDWEGIGIHNHAHQVALYPHFSLFNHSCSPNVMHSRNRDGSMLCVAIKEIKKGESLFVSYQALKAPFCYRQRNLLRWQFVCNCERCQQNISGQLVLQEMEQQKKQQEQLIGEIEQIDKYKDFKFPLDMYVDALVCECGNPLFRVYQNPNEVTHNGNEEKLNEPFYYICPKCLIPKITQQSEQNIIEDIIDSQGKNYSYQIGKFPQFHSLSCQYAIPSTESIKIYLEMAYLSGQCDHLAQAYKYYIKGRDEVQILFGKSDDAQMLQHIENCTKIIVQIKQKCIDQNIPLE
ncbi:MAG: hypothetical protein EZS28_030253 [Streblomastix strix]|uniref:SET domain-containing protein n=1 Tax=Streblomastix strix TaxID=222440 RepID=A0A5J4UVQ8_9EUKA|nr:MAG: hypothetical protein EZS28_030253 [Streblomastix strix]